MLRSMPTLNPRITITLTPACAAVLRELSSLGGQSQSSIVGELLETSIPVLERVVSAMRAASTIQATAKAEIASGLERAQAKLEDQLGLMLGEMDDSLRPLLDAAEKVTRRGAGGQAGGMRAARAAAGVSATSGVTTPVPLTGGSGHPKRGKVRVSTEAVSEVPYGWTKEENDAFLVKSARTREREREALASIKKVKSRGLL